MDAMLSDATKVLTSKLEENNKKRVVVLYVTDINKNQTVAGKYLADEISSAIVNQKGFQVFDRDNLGAIVAAKRLMAEGYIDAAGAKQLGQMLSVDAIVVGNYTVLSNTIRLSLKAIDATSGLVLSVSSKTLPVDNDLASLLGVNVPSNSQNGSMANRGFNAPLNSNENRNDPNTVGSACEKNNTGDYCFFNSTKYDLTVEIELGYIDENGMHPYDTNKTKFLLKPGQSKCVEGVSAKNRNHFVAQYTYMGDFELTQTKTIDEGEFRVEKCKSKTYNIK